MECAQQQSQRHVGAIADRVSKTCTRLASAACEYIEKAQERTHGNAKDATQKNQSENDNLHAKGGPK